MADDLTDRLRAPQAWSERDKYGDLHSGMEDPPALQLEAADRIDTLTARVAELEAERDAAIEARKQAQRDRESALAERNAAGVRARAEVAERMRALEAENAALLNRCGEEQAAAADGDALARALRAENARMRERENAACNLAEVAMSEAARVAAERDALRADAERYRWLRDGCNHKHSEASRIVVHEYGADWDALIDAARAAEEAAR